MRADGFLVLVVLLAGCLGAPGAEVRPAANELPSLGCAASCRIAIDTTAGSGWEPHVAVDPRDPLHVVVATRTQGSGDLPGTFMLWFDLHVTRDGGRTWNVTSLRYTRPLGSSADPDAPNVVGDPVLAFLPDGTLLATGATLQYVGVTPGVIRDVRLYVARSTDGGDRFDEPVTIARSEGFAVAAAVPGAPVPPAEVDALLRMPDKPWLTAGPDGTALLTWTSFVIHPADDPTASRGDILYAASRDGGRTWSEPGLVARGGSLQGSSSGIGQDGAWYVAYDDTAARMTHVAASRDQGATWRDRAVAPDAWMPSLAVARGAAHDRLFLATGAPAGAGQQDAIPQVPTLRWSDDEGATWSDPVALDAPEAPGRVLPSVAADARGVAYVTFAHARGQGASATSEFRAVALAPGRWRADALLDPSIAAPTSGLGDYLGLAPAPTGAFAVWTATNGKSFDTVGAMLQANAPG
ncbi:MAG: hypothetical protein QOE90_1190 [Thermoplasmata archaeon]|nr:hypothetical protein [Thermoplasmata archaeon]